MVVMVVVAVIAGRTAIKVETQLLALAAISVLYFLATCSAGVRIACGRRMRRVGGVGGAEGEDCGGRGDEEDAMS